MKKPLIGIAANLTCVDGGNKGSTTRVYINDSYVKSVELGGGVPVILPNLMDASLFDRQLEYFSRLVSGFHLSSIFIFRAEEAVPVSLSTARDFLWRRGWDSNPRLLRVTSFQD